MEVIERDREVEDAERKFWYASSVIYSAYITSLSRSLSLFLSPIQQFTLPTGPLSLSQHVTLLQNAHLRTIEISNFSTPFYHS